MESSTILSGFGGQGLLFAGQVLAQAGLEERQAVSWLPSYGPEMRGGTASCTVIVSDQPIGSPIVDAADVVIALNPPSLARFEPALRSGGLLVVNASLIDPAAPRRQDVEVVPVACSTIAREVGDERAVSVAAIGAAIARRPIVGLEAARAAVRAVAAKAGAAAVARDIAALDAGYRGSGRDAVAGASAPGAPGAPGARRGPSSGRDD
jgi:2-oxoglutarate ferredoxin oxidoreductase subunit gamma